MKIVELTQLLSREKRKSDRLFLPLKISYQLPKTDRWSDPLHIKNASGGGIQFISNKKIEKDTELVLKIVLPGESRNPILLKGTVVWSKNIEPTSKNYNIGIRFHKMQDDDRRRYITYLCEQIIIHNLKDKI